MEALYQPFISVGIIIADLSLLWAFIAFYFAWRTVDDDKFKYRGWTFLIIAATGGLFASVFYLFTLFPDLQDWVEIALSSAPLLFMGIGFAVLHHHKRKWEAWLLLDDETDMEV